MELELGFKISKDLNDYSSTDLRISKDRDGPLFVSRETDTMFVLTSHLKGYKRDNVKIEINEDGTRIAIGGERAVQEMVMVNWQMRKKEPEIRGFKRTFNIPEGVNLDKIKAKFNEEESVLTISMPKLVKGLRGVTVEEIAEKEPLQKENDLKKENEENVNEKTLTMEKENEEQVYEEAKDVIADEIPRLESVEETLESERLSKDDIGEMKEEKGKNAIEGENEENKYNEKSSKLCVPMIAGSALIVSIIVFVMHLIRNKNETSRKKN